MVSFHKKLDFKRSIIIRCVVIGFRQENVSASKYICTSLKSSNFQVAVCKKLPDALSYPIVIIK
jgi:hypothetical protein